MTSSYAVRAATLADSAGVTTLLEASYPPLFALGYDADALARALPLMTKANPRLLGSGTYHVAATSDSEIVGCGGWSSERPASGERQEGKAHIRHFATHPNWLRRGIGRAILSRCAEEAKAAGMDHFECYSSLVAVDFYRQLGFREMGPIDLKLGQGVTLPGMLMRRDLY